jgi:hypothetical protein
MTQPLIAVVVPQNRLWLWHQRIISVLQRSFDVDVYSHPAPHYPLSLQLWIRLEGLLLGEVELVKLVTSSSRCWSGIESAPYSFILNLSETPIIYGSTPVLEPRFEDQTDSLRLFAVLIARKNPYLSFHVAKEAQPIVASYVALGDRAVLIKGLQISFARLVRLAECAVHHLIRGSRPAPPPRPVQVGATTFSTVRMWTFSAGFFLDKLFSRPIRRLQNLEHWSVALAWSERWEIPHGIAPEEFAVLPDDRARYYADPFVIADRGQKWLFVEEFEYKTGKGVISCTQISAGEKIKPPTPVLVRPYHLAYPFIFRHDDEIYMIPETGSTRSVMMFRARVFPFDWVLHRVLLENIELHDSTLLRHQNRWWMFGTVPDIAGFAEDELAIFYSDCLEGPWQPHCLNPVKSDCRSARPGGRIIACDGRLLRPAQDCEKGYGSGLVWLEIEELTPDRFSEREIGRWPGRAVRGAYGLHTFNCDGDLAATDIKRHVWNGYRRIN